MHLFAKLRDPEAVDIGRQAGKCLGCLSGERDILPDLVGSRGSQTGQIDNELPNVCRALGKGVRPSDTPWQTQRGAGDYAGL